MPELFTSESMTAAMRAPTSASPDSASVSNPSEAAPEASSGEGVATTEQAAADGTVATKAEPTATISAKPTGPIPFDVHKTALENARTKAAEETKAQYAWADAIPAPHRAAVSELYHALDADPVTAIEALIVTAASDPVQAPALRSLLGRLLGGRAAPEPTATTPTPATAATVTEPDFQDEQGHQFYSATRTRDALTALEARILARLDPLTTDYQTRDAKARVATARAKAAADADTWAEARYAKVSQWPGFKDHEGEILKAITADPDLDVGDVYVDIVVPTLSQAERKKVVTSLQNKANAASVNPSTSASAVAGPPKTFQDAARQMWGA